MKRKIPIVVHDIKYDLLKIMEPWNGRLTKNSPGPVRRLYSEYLKDLAKSKLIKDHSIDIDKNEKSHIFYVNVRTLSKNSPQVIKIYVDYFRHPWCNNPQEDEK